MARIKIDKTFLSSAVGVFTALMIIYCTYELWFNPVEFTGKFAPPLAVVDYGTLVRARWISNRIFPYGIVMLIAVFNARARCSSSDARRCLPGIAEPAERNPPYPQGCNSHGVIWPA
jgi:hypothetical protein